MLNIETFYVLFIVYTYKHHCKSMHSSLRLESTTTLGIDKKYCRGCHINLNLLTYIEKLIAYDVTKYLININF